MDRNDSSPNGNTRAGSNSGGNASKAMMSGSPCPQTKGLLGRKKCILSCDGGGVRGIIIAVILERLESHLQNLEGKNVRISDYFDVLAGTSTGALIACLLVVPDPETNRPKYSAKDAISFYLQYSAEIFTQRSTFRSYSLCSGPLYTAIPLEKLLKKVFGDLKLSETVKPVIVPSYDIKYQTSVLFSTAQAKSKGIPDCFIRDVCRATTAVPTFFAPYHFASTTGDGVKREFNLVDGGVCANNPAFVAVNEVLRGDCEGIGWATPPQYEDLLVLSLGTGKPPESYTAKSAASWGFRSWVYLDGHVPILDIFNLASQDMVDYNVSSTFLEQGSHDNYLRVQTDLLDRSQMRADNTEKSNLKSLIASAEALLASQAQRRNKMGQFVPDNRWTTYDAALSQSVLNFSWFAEWLVAEKARRSE